ncbi:hypothetical protein BD310DRAFT_908172 [Dichomitus squalens]|uniref:Uncharacterized protein n=1 Tax=Dichomitus squalens TaxID=114155 RepID=A0A4Q9PN50_9APHY|nr:hypothetical protein BD310DRAFT_908172 [Dichomitus squalens]
MSTSTCALVFGKNDEGRIDHAQRVAERNPAWPERGGLPHARREVDMQTYMSRPHIPIAVDSPSEITSVKPASKLPVISSLAYLGKRVRSVIPDPIPQGASSKSGFTLDSSGVAGFFGGDSAVLAMASVNLIPNRRWVGWYNTPGSYEIAKQFGQLADSPFWDALVPGGKHEPAILFELDGKVGPEFIASYSGTTFAQTGHLAYLLTRKAKSMTGIADMQTDRVGTPTSLVIIDLPQVPPASDHPALPSSWLPKRSALLSLVPITGSVVACVFCALVADWYCCANIALGIIANGCACFVVGSGKLTYVISVTRGRFVLQYGTSTKRPETTPDESSNPPSIPSALGDVWARLASCGLRGHWQPLDGSTGFNSCMQIWKLLTSPSQRTIGYCALLLTVQFFVQLLLIPQGTLFGQIMFISTLALSWGYNSYLSSVDREDIQTDILIESVLRLHLKERARKYDFKSRTGTVVFACLAIPYETNKPPPDRMKILNALLPNDTRRC